MCTALVMGNMIGSGVFLLPAALAPLGWNAVIGWTVTIGGTLCLALVLSRLARLLPGGTGPFTYAAEAFGPGIGFIVAWSFWISCWTANAALAVAATSNLSIIFPGFAAKGQLPALLAIGFIWLFTAINLLGVRKAGGTQVLTLIIKLLPLLGAVIVAMWVLGSGTVTPPTLADAAPVNLSNIGGAATLTLFALLGFESALAVGDRVKDPEKTVPRATMIGAVATGIIYLLSCTAVTMLLPVATVEASNAPYATFFATLVSPAAGQLVALFAAIAALGALNGFTLLVGEIPRDMAQDGMLPSVLGRVNRFGAPVWSLLPIIRAGSPACSISWCW
jgi:APA family basic amino acid/polyamine antiporter